MDDFVDLTDQCLELGDIVSQNLGDRKLQTGDMTPIHYILAFNHIKSTDSLVSAVKLVDSGLIGDAEVIVRKIMDIAINLKFLDKDLELRQYQYWYYMVVEAKKAADKVAGCNKYNEPLRMAMEQLAPEASERYKQCEDIFEKDKKGKPKLQTWSGVNIGEMAEQCGLGTDYRICYKLFSASTHGGIGDLLHYFDPDGPSFGPRFKSENALALLLEAVRLYLLIVELVILGFDLDLMDSHRVIGEKLESFQGDSRLPNVPNSESGL